MVPLPTQVILEVTANCNLSCKGCAIHGRQGFVTRPLGTMAETIWRKTIDEIGGWNQKVNLSLHGGGEPLLHSDLKRIITCSKSFPNIQSGFLTNGMLLDEEWSAFVVEQELDWLAFSIDGVSPEIHHHLRKGSDLYRIEKNLLNLIRIRGNKSTPKISLNMVLYDEIRNHTEKFMEKWIDTVDSIMLSHYRNPPESKRWPEIPDHRVPCFLLWNQLVIAWDGRTGLCCEDFNLDFPIGDVKTETLTRIWNGEAISNVRKMHEEGQYDLHPMCKRCDSWADGRVVETEDERYRIRKRSSQTEYLLKNR